MRLGGKCGLKQPLAVVDLSDMPYLLKDCDAFTHYGRFMGAVINLLNSHWRGGARVDDALLVPNRDKCPSFIEHGPIFLN